MNIPRPALNHKDKVKRHKNKGECRNWDGEKLRERVCECIDSLVQVSGYFENNVKEGGGGLTEGRGGGLD